MPIHFVSALLLAGSLVGAGGEDRFSHARRAGSDTGKVVVEDFEADDAGGPPANWHFITSDKQVWRPRRALDSNEEFSVVREEGNQFVRAITRGEAIRFSIRNGNEMDWSLRVHPRLEWRWRAQQLPEGASEKGKNDVGGAVYVTFGTDWLGRPKSIKYTYSSALPIGTVVSFGPVKVIVVDSAREPRLGEWKTVQRNVINDYKQVFGDNPPERPKSITLWSDSDTTGDKSKIDVDDITLLPPRR